MRKSRSKSTVHTDATCHVCGGSLSLDIARRSNGWAFGITGVRWLLCSIDCVRKLGTNAA